MASKFVWQDAPLIYLVKRPRYTCGQLHVHQTRNAMRMRGVGRKVEADPRTIKAKDFPEDFGLLPGTFVMPKNSSKPSIFSPLRRLRLEWFRFKSRFSDFRSILGYVTGHGVKPRPRIRRKGVGTTALALHQRMYTAMAEGDRATLSEICCEGLQKQMGTRIDARDKNEVVAWKLHEYIGRPQVVSDRATGLPRKDSGLRQVIFRIRSKQSLSRRRYGAGGKNKYTSGTGEIKQLTEYLVVQRRILDSKEGPWKIWGSTKESDVTAIVSGKDKGGKQGISSAAS